MWGSVTTAFNLYSSLGHADVVEHVPRPYNSIKFPPHLQNQIAQASPKACSALLKQWRGAYMPLRVFEPVFNLTDASTFGPIRFKTTTMDAAAYDSAIGGLPDSIDHNFGIGVMSLTGIATSAQPFLKYMRRFEAIPAEGSPWGPFNTDAPPKDDCALTVVRTVTEQHPFMYPEDYNGLSVLGGTIWKVLRAIPKYARTAQAVSTAVADCVEDVTAEVEGVTSKPRRGLRFLGRAARGVANITRRVGAM